MDPLKVIVELKGKLSSEHGYSLASFVAISAATLAGIQVIRTEGLGFSGLMVLNTVLLIDSVTLFYAEARLKGGKRTRPLKRKRSA